MRRDKIVAIAGAMLAFYAAMVLLVQFFSPQRGTSLPQLFERQAMLVAMTNELARDSACIPLSAYGRNLAMALPENARVYVSDMLGPENAGKCGYYYFLRYYLFPREVAMALGGTMRFTSSGFTGTPLRTDEQLRMAGYDVVIDFPANKNPTARTLRQLSPHLQTEKSLVGAWDALVAFLFPLLVAFVGIRLVKVSFPGLVAKMNLWEMSACGFGLGMMVVAALTLWIKLTDVVGIQLVPVVVVALAGYELWVSRMAIWGWVRERAGETLWHPVVPILMLALVLFCRLATLEGLLEFDAVAAWMTKAKIIYLAAGNNLVGFFADPTLAHAHLDYPTLVPALHAATWGTVGRVNEFVTKCWPVWQLIFLLIGTGSVVKLNSSRWGGPLYWLLALAILPATVEYVRWEGATMPMMFFVATGMVQLALALQDQDRERLLLGGLLLLGAAMTKFEGMILCAVAAGGVVAGFPFVRRGWTRGWWKAGVLGLLSVSAFLWLRLHIPILHFESFWFRDAIQHLGTTLAYWPKLMAAIVTTCLFNSSFTAWTVVDGHMEWGGNWDGLGSLINQPTLGLAWVVILLTVAVWMAAPDLRRIVLWSILVAFGAMAFLAFVFGALGATNGFERALSGVADNVSGRYLLPVLMAWGSVMVCLLFRRHDSQAKSAKN